MTNEPKTPPDAAPLDDTCDNPWDAAAAEKSHETGCSLRAARDSVIIESLGLGDTKALAHFLIHEHVPGLNLRQYLALMLAPELQLPNETNVPFELATVKRGTAERRSAMGRFERKYRDKRLAEIMRKEMEERGKGNYDSVLKDMARKFRVGMELIRKAYDERYGKARYGKK